MPPRPNHLHAARDRFGTLLNRTAAAADRRTTPTRALLGLLAVVVATGATVGALNAYAAPPAGAAWQGAPELDGQVAPPTPAPATRMPPRPRADPPTARASALPAPAFRSWAVLDRTTGAITGSTNLAETSTTASMIKAWLVADSLRRTVAAGEEPSPARLGDLTLIIRDSDNARAEALYRELGAQESIERLIGICTLTDSSAVPGSWSRTRLSARDTARMAACLADGTAIGDSQWTEWLLEEMRQVRGSGDFGIRDALPDPQRSTVAIKNGWVTREDEGLWHVNCLAIGDTWTMGVLVRFRADLEYGYGGEICRSLAAAHLPDH